MNRIVLVDPVAAAAMAPSPEEALRPVGPGPVALADAMLNPSAEWGDGILDAVDYSIRRGIDRSGQNGCAGAMGSIPRVPKPGLRRWPPSTGRS